MRTLPSTAADIIAQLQEPLIKLFKLKGFLDVEKDPASNSYILKFGDENEAKRMSALLSSKPAVTLIPSSGTGASVVSASYSLSLSPKDAQELLDKLASTTAAAAPTPTPTPKPTPTTTGAFAERLKELLGTSLKRASTFESTIELLLRDHLGKSASKEPARLILLKEMMLTDTSVQAKLEPIIKKLDSGHKALDDLKPVIVGAALSDVNKGKAFEGLKAELEALNTAIEKLKKVADNDKNPCSEAVIEARREVEKRLTHLSSMLNDPVMALELVSEMKKDDLNKLLEGIRNANNIMEQGRLLSTLEKAQKSVADATRVSRLKDFLQASGLTHGSFPKDATEMEKFALGTLIGETNRITGKVTGMTYYEKGMDGKITEKTKTFTDPKNKEDTTQPTPGELKAAILTLNAKITRENEAHKGEEGYPKPLVSMKRTLLSTFSPLRALKKALDKDREETFRISAGSPEMLQRLFTETQAQIDKRVALKTTATVSAADDPTATAAAGAAAAATSTPVVAAPAGKPAAVPAAASGTPTTATGGEDASRPDSAPPTVMHES